VGGDIVPIANRSALASDYYSRKKITVSPLDFVRKSRRWPPRSARDAMFGAMLQQKSFLARDCTQKMSRDAVMPMKCGFPTCRM